jgi:protein associated with RNAse G/E
MAEVGRVIQIRGDSYDGLLHWHHQAYLLQDRDGFVLTQTPNGTPVETHRGPWISPFETHGHYWSDRWYNIIRLDNEQGLNGFYCNIATPARFDGETLRYADLQLDVRAFYEDGRLRYEVWDEDEFEEARVRLNYDDALVRDARAAVDELVRLIEAREFPFDV